MNVLFFIATLGFGMIVSGGVLTVLVSVGLVPRFAQETKTADHILTYENAIILGTIFGCLVTVFPQVFYLKNWLGILPFNVVNLSMLQNYLGKGILILYGMFAGIFEGCVALAIAEMLDSIPIFTKRVGFHKGLTWFVCAVGIGKAVGSLLYFSYSLYEV